MVSNKETEKLMKDYVKSQEFFEKCKLLPIKIVQLYLTMRKPVGTTLNIVEHCRERRVLVRDLT